MKKIIYFGICIFAITLLTNCNTKKDSPGAAAKEYTEKIKDGNYDVFVDQIIFEDETPRAMMHEEKMPEKAPQTSNMHKGTDMHKTNNMQKTTQTPQTIPVSGSNNATEIERTSMTARPTPQQQRMAYSAMVKENVEPIKAEKGNIKDVSIVSEKISNDGKTAKVVVKTLYQNGEADQIHYDMEKEKDTWKIKAGKEREVWRRHTADGKREVLKLKENEHRDIFKVKADGEKDVYKLKEEEHKEVAKVKEDDKKEFMKDKEKRHEEVIKTKHDGKKEVTKIKEERK